MKDQMGGTCRRNTNTYMYIPLYKVLKIEITRDEDMTQKQMEIVLT
jgi:hypothetical protein